jgi:hypothetical protein
MESYARFGRIGRSCSGMPDRSRLISGDDITPEQRGVFVRDAAELGTALDPRLENAGCREGRGGSLI